MPGVRYLAGLIMDRHGAPAGPDPATAFIGIGFDRMIRSDRPIRGVLRLPPGIPIDARHEDLSDAIIVRWHPPAIEVEAPIWSGDADALCFTAPGVAAYRCTHRSIAVTPRPDADPLLVEALLIATALPALLWMGGAFVLHAAAVVPGGEHHAQLSGLAIAGASGSGKSRLAAALIANGGALLADDSVAVRWRDDQVMGSGLAAGYHLAARNVEDRPFHAAPRVARLARLAAVLILGNHGRGGPLELAEAVGLLLTHRHRANVPRQLGIEAHAMASAARLARTVPVYRWSSKDADSLIDEKVRADIMRTGKAR
jgi:hypothetical protein